jgi:hypothetical protein
MIALEPAWIVGVFFECDGRPLVAFISGPAVLEFEEVNQAADDSTHSASNPKKPLSDMGHLSKV